jgi:hypothetical protein
VPVPYLIQSTPAEMVTRITLPMSAQNCAVLRWRGGRETGGVWRVDGFGGSGGWKKDEVGGVSEVIALPGGRAAVGSRSP